jgi:hypothetical protein
MGFQVGYLTPKQQQLWRKRFDGYTQAEISREAKISRQTVSKSFNVIDSKVSKALFEAAKLNRIEIIEIDREKGYLLGRSPTFQTNALITFSDVNGLQLWYKGEGNCSECDSSEKCRETLTSEAKIRGIELFEDQKNMQPTLIADRLFEKLMRE